MEILIKISSIVTPITVIVVGFVINRKLEKAKNALFKRNPRWCANPFAFLLNCFKIKSQQSNHPTPIIPILVRT